MKHLRNFFSKKIEPLTIQEFTALRDAMYAVKNTDDVSSYQGKNFFNNEENFDRVIEKLRKLLEA